MWINKLSCIDGEVILVAKESYIWLPWRARPTVGCHGDIKPRSYVKYTSSAATVAHLENTLY